LTVFVLLSLFERPKNANDEDSHMCMESAGEGIGESLHGPSRDVQRWDGVWMSSDGATDWQTSATE
jgi:hypothetical protein